MPLHGSCCFERTMHLHVVAVCAHKRAYARPFLIRPLQAVCLPSSLPSSLAIVQPQQAQGQSFHPNQSVCDTASNAQQGLDQGCHGTDEVSVCMQARLTRQLKEARAEWRAAKEESKALQAQLDTSHKQVPHVSFTAWIKCVCLSVCLCA